MQIFQDMTPSQHCTGSNARDALGAGVFATDPSAIRWCATGWIEKHGCLMNYTIVDAVATVAKRMSITSFNDIGSITYANDSLGWMFIQALKDAGL